MKSDKILTVIVLTLHLNILGCNYNNLQNAQTAAASASGSGTLQAPAATFKPQFQSHPAPSVPSPSSAPVTFTAFKPIPTPFAAPKPTPTLAAPVRSPVPSPANSPTPITPVIAPTPSPPPIPSPTPTASPTPVQPSNPPVPTPTATPQIVIPGGGGPGTVPVANMPPGFSGVNKGGYGSWFRADNTGDSTNGHSWCGFPYSDSSNGFAPDITVMTGGTNAVWPSPDWAPSATAYCGLEALVTDPSTGVSKIMYVIDAFDHRWVKAPGSIDIMMNAWSSLTNTPAVDKNIVIYNVTWTFTGYRSIKYSFNGPGDP